MSRPQSRIELSCSSTTPLRTGAVGSDSARPDDNANDAPDSAPGNAPNDAKRAGVRLDATTGNPTAIRLRRRRL